MYLNQLLFGHVIYIYSWLLTGKQYYRLFILNQIYRCISIYRRTDWIKIKYT